MFKLFVRAIIEDEKGDFLYVEKNEKQKIAPWKSLLPWWSIEFSEIPEEALKREVFWRNLTWSYRIKNFLNKNYYYMRRALVRCLLYL